MLNDQPTGPGGGNPYQDSPGTDPQYPPTPGDQAGGYLGPGGYPARPGYQQPGYPQGSYQQGGYPIPGAPPQHQGGYAPPPGNYPPPPGSYPYQPPSQWGWGQPPAGAQPTSLRVRDALGYGWKKFAANIGVWLAFMGLLAAMLVVFYIILFVVIFTTIMASGAYQDSSYGVSYDTVGLTIATIVAAAVAGFFGYLVAGVLTRGALLELDGVKPTFGAFWRIGNLGNVVLFALVASVVNAVVNGALNPYLGMVASIVLGVAIWFVLHFLLDRNLSLVDAIVANLRVLASNPGPLVLLLLTLIGINTVGALLCGLGLIFTLPVSIIAVTYAYRVLTGGFVSPAY